MDVAKEFANAGVNDKDLLALIQERMETRNRAAPPKTDSELELLCYIFFDLTARGPLPMFPTLDSFLSRYHQECLTTVEVITTIVHSGLGCSEPDDPLFDLEIMPKTALEFLKLVNPRLSEEDKGLDGEMSRTPFRERLRETRPTKCSIAARRWPNHPLAGRWAQIVQLVDEGDSYMYFLEHYMDADRDARVLDMWRSRCDKEEGDADDDAEERPRKRARKDH